MSKILKNNTASPVVIDDVGQTIPASGQLTVEPTDYLLYAASADLATLINASTVTVNDGVDDLSVARGIDFMEFPDYAFNIRFAAEPEVSNGITKKNVQEAIQDSFSQAEAARFSLVLQHNGTVSDGTFYSYSNLTPGVEVVVGIDAIFLGFTWANANANADYTLDFRKNTEVGVPFYTVSKVNTKFFTDENPSESFLAGDYITIEHSDDGGNASDVGLVLYFQASV
jgi:hypothetical protein